MVLALAPATACHSGSRADVRTIDLLRRFGDADRRPADGSFGLVEHTCGGLARASISTPVPSRITWTTPVPERAVLNVDVVVPDSSGEPIVNFRIGISDDRVYESLVERTVSSAVDCRWTRLVADLSPYAGTKLSIFYQPNGRTWHLVLGADPIQGRTGAVYWGAPGVDTDAAAARAFVHRIADNRVPPATGDR
jgi:hypothetical protein